eukprot:1152798-Pelagomonas_calceolata.AAC.1
MAYMHGIGQFPTLTSALAPQRATPCKLANMSLHAWKGDLFNRLGTTRCRASMASQPAWKNTLSCKMKRRVAEQAWYDVLPSKHYEHGEPACLPSKHYEHGEPAWQRTCQIINNHTMLHPVSPNMPARMTSTWSDLHTQDHGTPCLAKRACQNN